ncbi:hypothetical protein GQ600_7459 [Phytophthora cactorum]|nr:hypothetical protein GQ600_7459 [Phytophthora cactorum]
MKQRLMLTSVSTSMEIIIHGKNRLLETKTCRQIPGISSSAALVSSFSGNRRLINWNGTERLAHQGSIKAASPSFQCEMNEPNCNRCHGSDDQWENNQSGLNVTVEEIASLPR